MKRVLKIFLMKFDLVVFYFSDFIDVVTVSLVTNDLHFPTISST